jgi:hypothetical protein
VFCPRLPLRREDCLVSWDLFVMRLPDGVDNVDELPTDFVPEPMGTRAEVLDAIVGLVPSADFSDPTSLVINGPGFSIEVSVTEDPVRTFTCSARGDEAAIPIIVGIIGQLGATAFDPQSDGGTFTIESATTSFRRWSEYRDRNVPD